MPDNRTYRGVSAKMKNWTEDEWTEWRREREGILIYEAGYTEAEATSYAKTLEALEKLRVATQN